MNAAWIDAKVNLDIREIDPEYQIDPKIYDDNGDVVRFMTNEEFELELSRVRGKRQFIATITLGNQRLTVASPHGDPEMRRALLCSTLERICAELSTKLLQL